MAKTRNPLKPDEPIRASGARKQRPSELVASARVKPIGESMSADTKSRSAPAWQSVVWDFYDAVGEVHYSAAFIAACLSRCVLTVGVPDDDGKIGPAFDADGNPVTDENDQPIPGLERAEDALALVRGLKSDVGGQPQMLRNAGLNLFVAADMYLVGTPKFEGTAPSSIDAMNVSDLQWEILSTQEFKPQDRGYQRVRYPGAVPEEITAEQVYVVRIWKSHPRYSEMADSSLLAVSDILEELVLLTRGVRSETLSRIANAGVFLVPAEIDYSNDDADDGEGDEGDPFTTDLIKSMSRAIEDKGSASAFVPMVVRAPQALLHPDGFRLIEFPIRDSNSEAKRKEAVQRFAQGIDLPVEVVTGHAGTTFANAIQIDDSTFKVHIEPIMEIFCDALTVGYLRPALGDDTPLVIHYDATELVTRPNRAQDAKDLWDRDAVSDASLRNANGFSESDAPDDEELKRRLEAKKAKAPQQGPPSPLNGGPLDQGGLDNGNNTDGNLTASIAVAAEVLIERAVQTAGARIRSKTNAKPQLQAIISQVPDSEVAVTLGEQTVALLMGDVDLFNRAFDPLWSWVVRTTGDRAMANRLRVACHKAASKQLFEPRVTFSMQRALVDA